MPFEIHSTNGLQHIADEPFSKTCPHCNALSGLSLVSAPRYEYMRRFKSEWVGFVYRCDACNQPVFLKSQVLSHGDPISFSKNMVEIERPAESFELQHLPGEVAEDFKEALVCYSNSCWNAFAAMTRRALQSARHSSGKRGLNEGPATARRPAQNGGCEGRGFQTAKSHHISRP